MIGPGRRATILALAGLAIGASPAAGQEAYFTPSATQPSPGTVTLRERLLYTNYGNDPTGLEREVDDLRLSTLATVGLTRDLALSLELPATYRWIDGPASAGTDDLGVGDLTLLAKYRVLRLDHGPIDTTRAALLAGVEVRSGDGKFSSHSEDPILGAAITAIRGRHGLSAGVQYKFSTASDDRARVRPGDGGDDLLLVDAAYLYRLAPAQYASDTHAALYAVLELNTVYETGGDREVLLSPGLLYEARRWAAEVTVRFPVHSRTQDRPETEFAVGVGLRFQF